MAALPPMDFLFELDLPGAGERELRAIAAACADAAHWPARFMPGREERRWFGVRKHYPAALELPGEARGVAVLSSAARPDAEAIPFAPPARPLLAATITEIARHAPEGFDLRATWVGSPIEATRAVTLAELLALVDGAGLNEFTRYRVAAAASTASLPAR